MSRTAKVRLAEILHSAGYSERPVLAAIGYPHCASISAQPEPGVPVEITVHAPPHRTRQSLTDTRPTYPFARPILPGRSYVEHTGTQTLSYHYEPPAQPRKLVATDRVSIPNPPGWPKPAFIHPRYPAAP